MSDPILAAESTPTEPVSRGNRRRIPIAVANGMLEGCVIGAIVICHNLIRGKEVGLFKAFLIMIGAFIGIAIGNVVFGKMLSGRRKES